MNKKQLQQEVEGILGGTHLSQRTTVEVTNDNHIVIGLFWGDWKHEHRHLEHVMKMNGYEQINENVTEEDGSDCYSAEHVFRKVA